MQGNRCLARFASINELYLLFIIYVHIGVGSSLKGLLSVTNEQYLEFFT